MSLLFLILYSKEMVELDYFLKNNNLITTTLEAITGEDPSANIENLQVNMHVIYN